jgi:hypothetical protein
VQLPKRWIVEHTIAWRADEVITALSALATRNAESLFFAPPTRLMIRRAFKAAGTSRWSFVKHQYCGRRVAKLYLGGSPVFACSNFKIQRGFASGLPKTRPLSGRPVFPEFGYPASTVAACLASGEWRARDAHLRAHKNIRPQSRPWPLLSGRPPETHFKGTRMVKKLNRLKEWPSARVGRRVAKRIYAAPA